MQKDTNERIDQKPVIQNRQTIADSVFGSSLFSYLYRKSEKIANAMYLLTSHFRDDEPLKWSIRSDAVMLPRAVAALSIDGPTNVGHANEMELSILTLSSDFEISFVTGLISEANYRIVMKELNLLYETLRSRRSSRPMEKSVLGDPMFFDVGFPAPSPLQKGVDSASYRSSRVSVIKSYIPMSYSKGHSKGHGDVVDSSFRSHGLRMSDSGSEKTDESTDDAHTSSRVDAILGVLKSRKEISVRDLLEFVDDCSEKTLQRELNSLVHSGMVSKHGDRRWSRYSLNR